MNGLNGVFVVVALITLHSVLFWFLLSIPMDIAAGLFTPEKFRGFSHSRPYHIMPCHAMPDTGAKAINRGNKEKLDQRD